MTTLILSIGIPGSGKTTILKKLALENNFEYISPDDIRKEMFGREDDHTYDKIVWNEARKRVTNLLEAKHDVAFDSTFSNRERRRRFIHDAKKAGAQTVEGLFFDIPLEEILQRNASREKSVAEEYLQTAYAELQSEPPSAEDGFDSLFRVDLDGDFKQLFATNDPVLPGLYVGYNNPQ